MFAWYFLIQERKFTLIFFMEKEIKMWRLFLVICCICTQRFLCLYIFILCRFFQWFWSKIDEMVYVTKVLKRYIKCYVECRTLQNMLSKDVVHHTKIHKYLFLCLKFDTTEKLLPWPSAHEVNTYIILDGSFSGDTRIYCPRC